MITYAENDDLDCKDRDCPWYDPFDNRCTAWECDGLECDVPLPCEQTERS